MSSEHEDEHWAIKLMQEQSTWQPSVLRQYGEVLCGGIIGVCGPLTANYFGSRPLHAGFQRHIACTIIGASIGYGIKLLVNDWSGKRDAIMIDYIRRHPERFPEPERKRFADVFMPWGPIR
ncbi:NADH dehydrogenase [ubiquinone] 1 subunit C2 [Cephus cinctus]|uniref:NADH dehydrogenase [ubiquinone] 1 subunit C2 n=1 Tax=Cephus cinctus TaxID=211228 RepID=A0AAJ7FDT3_CEPCN|nr:NADH dehydrogenase [ubiquinone] 1 subunit C2 [Cephus cinctus]XP_015586818.1 NADH dehydrogenase [ubiquinone] 1 subunit C2 [Cephus cinctus]XP_015586819.1 NADH dehydrogenase [ubiquinone] 1 subunit C2 [Cephus cinctus]